MKKEHPKDFDILWVCRNCGEKSLYYMDLEEHKSKAGHSLVAEFDLNTGSLVAQYQQ